MKNHGIPDENIVVMMYDDIANNKENPFKGNIINQPNGPNVYPDVLKDYTKEEVFYNKMSQAVSVVFLLEVTPDVFIKVLTGDEDGLRAIIGRSGKVIKSGPNDNIFVFFSDHGAPGLIAFPRQFLHAPVLQAAITKMHQQNKYKQMVFYIEACESGSMFSTTLPNNINVFATTASNPTESSYARYLDKERNTYLGDVYSVMWMQDSDKENLNTLTLQKQFEIVKQETNTSHVMEYGNLNDAVKSEDVPLRVLQLKIDLATTSAERATAYRNLLALKKKYLATDSLFEEIIHISVNNDDNVVTSIWNMHLDLTQFLCYQTAVDNLHASCPGLELPRNDYALRRLYTLVNLCELGLPDLSSAISTVTSSQAFCIPAR